MISQTKMVKKATLFRVAVYEDDGALIKGWIENTATFAKFKDIVVKVSYYSRTETLIDKKQFVIYDYYEPNSTKFFSIKVYPPSAYKEFGFQIVDAKYSL